MWIGEVEGRDGYLYYKGVLKVKKLKKMLEPRGEVRLF